MVLFPINTTNQKDQLLFSTEEDKVTLKTALSVRLTKNSLSVILHLTVGV